MESDSPTPEQRDTMLNCFAPDVLLVQTPDLPYGGTFHGREGFAQWSETMNTLFDKVDVQVKTIFEDGDEVIIYSDCTLKVRKNQKERTTELLQ